MQIDLSREEVIVLLGLGLCIEDEGLRPKDPEARAVYEGLMSKIDEAKLAMDEQILGK